MKTFKDFNIIDETEELFLQLAHLDELEIKFNFIKFDSELFYFYKDCFLFEQDKQSEAFYIRYGYFWDEFEKDLDNNHSRQDIEDFFNNMIEKYFKITGYSVLPKYAYGIYLICKYFDII